MWFKLLAVILLFPLALAAEGNEDSAKPDLSNGFGADIDWVHWEKAQSVALDLDKPIFFLIHKTWCGACKSLKQNFQSSNKRKELVELSSQFVMVNVEDDDEPDDKMYAPDGGYIPRLLFLNKHGVPLEVNNKKNYPKNAYYYPLVADIVKAMKQALKEYASKKDEQPEEGQEEVTTTSEKAEDDKKATKEDSAKETKEAEEKPKKSKTEKQPADKQKKDANAEKKSEKAKKNEENKEEQTNEKSQEKEKKQTKTKEKSGDENSKDEEKPSGGCPHAAAAKAKAAKKEQEKKTKSESKEGKTEDDTKAKETKKSQQNKKSEL